jgi:hypothetical protein
MRCTISFLRMPIARISSGGSSIPREARNERTPSSRGLPST